MGEEKVNEYKDSLANQIADKINPTSITLEVAE